MFSAFSGWTEVRGCEGASLIERRHAAATVQHIHVFVWRVRTYTHGCSSSDQKVRSASSAAAAAAFQSASAPSTAWPFAPYFRSSSTTCCPAGPALSANAHPDCPPSVSRPASHLRSAVHWVEGCTQLAAKRGGEEGGAGRAVLAPEAGRKLQSKGQVEAMVWGLKGWGGDQRPQGNATAAAAVHRFHARQTHARQCWHLMLTSAMARQWLEKRQHMLCQHHAPVSDYKRAQRCLVRTQPSARPWRSRHARQHRHGGTQCSLVCRRRPQPWTLPVPVQCTDPRNKQLNE